MTHAVLVYDSGSAVGLGHQSRIQALAHALTALDVTAEMRPLGGPVDGDIVVVDSYLVRADDPTWFRAGTLVALDDLQRDLAVDVLVDPSPGSEALAHVRAHIVLAGASFAVIDPAISDLRPAPIATGNAGRAFVTFGGSDAAIVAGPVAEALNANSPQLTVTVTLPDAAPTPAGSVSVLADPRDFRDELARSDVVVCAGGVTLLEALALGRPTVVVALADNQRIAVDHVVEHGAALAGTVDDAAVIAAGLVTDASRRQGLSERARALVDGRGAGRVAEQVVATHRRSTP